MTIFAIPAPLFGPLNVTVIPESRVPDPSFTSTVKGAAKVAPSVAVCWLPEIAAMLAGTGAEPVLVNKNAAGVAKLAGPIPAAAAVTW